MVYLAGPGGQPSGSPLRNHTEAGGQCQAPSTGRVLCVLTFATSVTERQHRDQHPTRERLGAGRSRSVDKGSVRRGFNDFTIFDGVRAHMSTLLLAWVVLKPVSCQGCPWLLRLLRKLNLNQWSQ